MERWKGFGDRMCDVSNPRFWLLPAANTYARRYNLRSYTCNINWLCLGLLMVAKKWYF
jgi:hypothetical protein